MGVLTISTPTPTIPLSPPLPPTTTTTTTVSTNSTPHEKNSLHLSLKFLDIEGVVRDRRCEISITKSLPYYKLVETACRAVRRDLTHTHFNSVELFSRTGYPLANSPRVFLCPVSSWHLEENELLYVYPKVLQYGTTFVSDVDAVGSVVSIPLKDSKSVFSLLSYTDGMFVCDLKTNISLRLHIPFDNITMWQYNKHKQQQEPAINNEEIALKTINQRQLSFSISSSYDDCHFLSSFRSQLYTSHIPIPLPSFHDFNCQLLYLVREYSSTKDKDRLKRRLGTQEIGPFPVPLFKRSLSVRGRIFSD